jgi:hypothetical protein
LVAGVLNYSAVIVKVVKATIYVSERRSSSSRMVINFPFDYPTDLDTVHTPGFSTFGPREKRPPHFNERGINLHAITHAIPPSQSIFVHMQNL